MYLFNLISLFFILTSPDNFLHESYTSITEINFSKERSMIEISIEITAHDISYLFENEEIGVLKPIFNEGKEYFSNEPLEKYINNHFKIYYQNKLINLDFLGNEINLDGELMIFMEAKMKKSIHSVEIINDLLITSFPNQQNIVNLRGTINSSHTFNKYESKHFFN